MKKLLLIMCALCFASIASAEEFSADMISVVAGMTTNSKIYQKSFDTSRTEAMGIIVISKDGDAYQIFDQTKKYVLMTEKELQEQSPMADADSFEEFVKQNDFKKLGSEKVSGYKCDIYEGDIDYAEGQPPVTLKMWYSSKLEFPVKTETQLPGAMGMAISTLQNIQVGKQPASLFEVPAGYTRVENMQEAMGLGGFMMPSGGEESEGADEMPSEEEMNQMMQMMQEMMGGMQD